MAGPGDYDDEDFWDNGFDDPRYWGDYVSWEDFDEYDDYPPHIDYEDK